MSRFFGDAPILTVSGRNHPIEVRYAAADDEEDPDLPACVAAAFRDIAATPGPIGGGDVLVFLPGEREIRDVAELLEREQPDAEVLTLYSRLSWEQQSRIFKRGPRRRIVLATNVAETSITVPGIRSVIDSGLARISRYSPRNRLQRLPIEPVSRASAEQRKGRCGRVGPGLCVRLYSSENFEARPEFTEPEVLRTNLAALLLRLAADGLGEAESFPFIDPPDARALSDGYRLLQELQALDAERRITGRGRAMARLPLDPRLSRALLESRRFHAESELLAIVAGLSVPDARISRRRCAERPRPAALYEDSKSDFGALIKLWRAYRKAREGPRRELRRWCKERQLSLLRLSEWEDVHAQIADRAAGLGMVGQRKSASYTAVHRALLAGFCTMVGMRGEEGEYLGPRGVRFHIFPGSALKRRRPRWVMAANIVETSRVFGRLVAEIEPMWIESAARHLSKREFLEPDWDEAREEVVARERVTFLGLVLSANRIVNYGPIAPEESRLIFAREALVYGRLQRRPEWLLANDAAIRAAEQMEERLRVRDLVQPPEFFVELLRCAASPPGIELRDARALHAAPVGARAAGARAHARADLRALAGPRSARAVSRDRARRGRCGSGRIPLRAGRGGRRRNPQGAAARAADVDARRGRCRGPGARRAARRRVAALIAEGGAPGFDSHRGRRAGFSRRARGAVGGSGGARKLAAARARDSRRAREVRSRPGARSSRAAPGGDRRRPGARLGIRSCRPATRLCGRRRAAGWSERARRAYPDPWRRFEAEELPHLLELDLPEGTAGGVSDARPRRAAARRSASSGRPPKRRPRGAAAPAASRKRCSSGKHAIWRRASRANLRLILGASPYFSRDALVDLMLELAFRRACFEDQDAPRTRAEFEASVDRGRAELHPALEAIAGTAEGWFAQAREVRRAARGSARARAAAARRGRPRRIWRGSSVPARLGAMSADWLRHVPRYLKAEERRWQRVLARGARAGAAPARARALDLAPSRLEGAARRGARGSCPSSRNCASGPRSTASRCTRRSSRPSVRYPRPGSPSAPHEIESWLAR